MATPHDIRQIRQGETGEQGDIFLSGSSGSYDIAYAPSTDQHHRDILLSQPGEIRQHPSAGVGLINYQDDEGVQRILEAVAAKLQKDGARINLVSITAIDAPYPDK